MHTHNLKISMHFCLFIKFYISRIKTFLFYQDYKMLRKKQGVGTIRYVTVVKGENEGLGISITVSCLNIF